MGQNFGNASNDLLMATEREPRHSKSAQVSGYLSDWKGGTPKREPCAIRPFAGSQYMYAMLNSDRYPSLTWISKFAAMKTSRALRLCGTSTRRTVESTRVIVASSDTNRICGLLPDLCPGRSQTIRAFEIRGTRHTDQGDFDSRRLSAKSYNSLCLIDQRPTVETWSGWQQQKKKKKNI